MRILLSVLFFLLNHGIGFSITLEEALPRLYNQDPALTALDLESHDMRPGEAQALAEALMVNKTLTTLILSHNYIIDPEGAIAIARALKVNNTLTTLDLSYNGLSTEGLIAIAEALMENHTLKTLILSQNYINPEGATAIARALMENHTLTTLDLSCNELSTEGLIAIAEALMENHTLKTLILFGNILHEAAYYFEAKGAVGAAAFAKALKVNCTLTTLDLEENEIDEDQIAEIQALLTPEARTQRRFLRYILRGIVGADENQVQELMQSDIITEAIRQVTFLRHRLRQEGPGARLPSLGWDVWENIISAMLNRELR